MSLPVLATGPAIVVHGIAHVMLATAPARPVTLLSAEAAALFAGAGWWRALIDGARIDPGLAATDLLDCADAPGRALEALACGCRALVLLPCPAWPMIAERAAGCGALLLDARPPALDLAAPGADRRIAAWLGIG